MTGAQILWECLVREGRDRRLRLSRRRDPAGLRRDARLSRSARPGAARAGRDAHGRRLRARDGRVGVAIATSGPGATNMVTGIATAMMDSSPIVCITGPGAAALIGSDAFQETDITGITLPITKHNYLVTDAGRHRAGHARGVLRRAVRAGPGPVLVDITKDAQQGTCEVRLGRRRGQPPGYRPDRPSPRAGDFAARPRPDQRRASRPVILAGPRHHRVGRVRGCSAAFAERAHDPGRDDAARHRRRSRRRIRSTSA